MCNTIVLYVIASAARQNESAIETILSLGLAHEGLARGHFYDCVTTYMTVDCRFQQLLRLGSHASWKVLDFFFKIQGPGKSLWSWRVLEVEV